MACHVVVAEQHVMQSVQSIRTRPLTRINSGHFIRLFPELPARQPLTTEMSALRKLSPSPCL
jgi:hypothetical protein